MERINFLLPKRNLSVKKKTGRPRKVSPRMKRLLQRNPLKLRDEGVYVTVENLVQYCGFSLQTTSLRTYVRCLNEMGFRLLQTRRKGLRETDQKVRLQYARKMDRKEKNNAGFWREVCFYLDGVSFVYKTNPMNTAMAPKSRVWRRKNEGLQVTSKGSKDLAGGKRLHVMVAMAYRHGVILREPYEKLNGKFFANFIREHFNLCFGRAGPKRNRSRKFVMDNDSSQTSKAAMNALQETESELLRIPTGSPDLNPIENIFNVVKDTLEKEAIERNITKETFEEFKTRVLRTLGDVDPGIIDRAIDSMPTRIKLIIQGNGYQTKY